MKEKKQKRVTIYVPEEDYNKLRVKLILTGKTVSAWVRDLIKKFLAN
jgi:Ribbon-helix-helix protein, copG family